MRILIVEDEPMIACALALELQDAGHEVVGPAYSVEEARALAFAGTPQLGLIDINLAGHDEGIELARLLRAELGVYTLFVSGQIAQARADADAAIGILPKPFRFEALAAIIEAAAELMEGRRPACTPPGLELFIAA
jgi:two-component system, response regulator PdtaR